MKTAIVFGGSGLIGSNLIQELDKNTSYSSIIAFVRKPLNSNAKKLKEIVVDFKLPDSAFSNKLRGDEVYICLGTTIKKAGTIENMEQIDRDLPIKIAELSQTSGIKKLAVVSSVGANSNSRNYYLRIKGEMENAIRRQGFDNIVIARPSILLGQRKEVRFGEILGKLFIKLFGGLFIGSLRKYRGIHAKTVAKAMINILNYELQEVIYESDRLEQLGL